MLTVVGLMFNIIGAWCLAYEVLWRLPKENWRKTTELHLEHLTSFLKLREAEIDALPESVYFAEDKAKLKEELNRTFQPQIEEKRKYIVSLGLGHSHRSYDLAWLGMALLTVGFGLQIVGVRCDA